MLVSIVIPCYNSEQTIEKVVDLCVEEFDKMPGYECEMVLVNDFSRDKTFEAITRCAEKYPNVIGLNLAKNFGQHAAIMAGLNYVSGDYVVGMDDDMQNHPSQIRQFIEKAEEGYDVVFGVFEQRKFSTFKNITGAISRSLLFKLVDRPKDIQMSSFWLARKFVIDRVVEYEGSNAFIQLLFFRTTANIANITIEHFEREVGTSNYTFKKSMKLFMSFMNYSMLPLRIATYLGVICAIAGVAGGIVVFINKLIRPDMAVGWSSLMCVILVLFGIAFLILGIVGEYVGKILMTDSRTPQFVIRDELNVKKDKNSTGDNHD